MTDPYAAPDPFVKAPTTPQPYGQPSGTGLPAPSGQPAPYGQPAPFGDVAGQLGKVRGTGVTILLFFVTFGIYGLFWYYAVHSEMKRHSGVGLSGGFALVIAVVVGIVSPFLVSNDVGELYSRRGQQPPVTAATGCWYFPGMFLLVGPIVWFVKTNGALNDYWRSLGAA